MHALLASETADYIKEGGGLMDWTTEKPLLLLRHERFARAVVSANIETHAMDSEEYEKIKSDWILDQLKRNPSLGLSFLEILRLGLNGDEDYPFVAALDSVVIYDLQSKLEEHFNERWKSLARSRREDLRDKTSQWLFDTLPLTVNLGAYIQDAATNPMSRDILNKVATERFVQQLFLAGADDDDSFKEKVEDAAEYWDDLTEGMTDAQKAESVEHVLKSLTADPRVAKLGALRRTLDELLVDGSTYLDRMAGAMHAEGKAEEWYALMEAMDSAAKRQEPRQRKEQMIHEPLASDESGSDEGGKEPGTQTRDDTPEFVDLD